MTTSEPDADARAIDVTVDRDEFTVVLEDGRRLTVPVAWFPRLRDAAPEQRDNWELLGGGVGIRWPDVDEDLSVAGLLRGAPGPGSSKRAS